MHICFVIDSYPYFKYETGSIFVKNLIHEIADRDIKCSVISPQSLTKSLVKRSKLHPRKWTDITNKGSKIEIRQPICTTVSNFRIMGQSISSYLVYRACEKAFKKMDSIPDIMYSHFWHNAISAALIGKKYDIKTVVASGESTIDVHNKFSKKMIENALENIKGVICVSSKNYEESKKIGLLNSNSKYVIIPNAVEKEKFYKMDKTRVRRTLGFDENDTIAIFVGMFTHRKGSLRFLDAIDNIDEIKAILIGDGSEVRDVDNVIFRGKVGNEEIASYLNASDMFVLPTFAEGCCNAIVEALACGVPVISSDRSFNWDILDDSNSILVDPNDIKELANAMKTLSNDRKLREKLSNGALKSAENLTIDNRAKKVIDFICGLK